MSDDPPYQITITPMVEVTPTCDDLLRQVVTLTLHRHHIERATINITLVDDAHISRLHETHLGHKGPTDVLTFNLRDTKDNTPNDGLQIEGEIVVSVDTAINESNRRSHSVLAELALYVVHGVLHLLGYNDSDRTASRRMHKVEDEILEAAGLGPVFGAL